MTPAAKLVELLDEAADLVAMLRMTEPALADELARFDRIRHVIEWLTGRATLGAGVDMVGQDEFHYDFLAPLPPGNRWLVFGVT